MQKEQGGVRALSTVLHTLDLLTVFAGASVPLRLAEVTNAVGLGRATVYQRLLTLVEAGLLEIDEDQRYRLSMYPARLAHAALQQAGLDTRAQSQMTELMQLTGETVSLAVLDHNQACIAARVETNMLLRAEQKIGSHMPLAGSASGRVLAAWMSQSLREGVIASGEPFPEEALLQDVRDKGYAISSGYSGAGVIGLAAPIFGASGEIIAALSIVIPEQRFEIEANLAHLKRAAERLNSIFMGSKTKT